MNQRAEAVDQLLSEWAGKRSPGAEDELYSLVYAELRRLAGLQLRHERGDQTLQPTVLVNEAYLKLLGRTGNWQGRAHFYAVAAQVMRSILVDYARARRVKGHGVHQVEPEGEAVTFKLDNIIEIDEALSRLAEVDPRQSHVVELRFFAGLTDDDIAELLGVNPRTVKRDWNFARAWLYSEIRRRSAK